jgi:hypothetical protein
MVDKITAANKRTDDFNCRSAFNPIVDLAKFLAVDQSGYDHNGANGRMSKIGKGFQSLSQPTS